MGESKGRAQAMLAEMAGLGGAEGGARGLGFVSDAPEVPSSPSGLEVETIGGAAEDAAVSSGSNSPQKGASLVGKGLTYEEYKQLYFRLRPARSRKTATVVIGESLVGYMRTLCGDLRVSVPLGNFIENILMAHFREHEEMLAVAVRDSLRRHKITLPDE